MGIRKTMITNVARQCSSAEVEQAIIRLVVGVLAIVYCLKAAFSGRVATSLAGLLVPGGMFFLAASIILIRVWNHGSMVTRLVGMVLDIGTLSYLISILNEPGFLLLPIYLWVMVGNGLRYGLGYLLVATGLSSLSLVWVFTYGNTWAHSQYMAAGWVLALLVLPAYFGVLLRRLQKQATALEGLSQHMEMLATHDTLTALPNRSLFMHASRTKWHLLKEADSCLPWPLWISMASRR